MICRSLLFLVIAGAGALAQGAPEKPAPEKAPEKPQVKINYLNVCTLTADDQKELSAALARINRQPRFADDFEISRGRTTLEGAQPARYLRLRREYRKDPYLATAQYSLSSDAQRTAETLVVHPKEARESVVSIEAAVTSSAAAPTTVVSTDTPASRIELERLGKASIVLSRCPTADQTAFQPLFDAASSLLAGYRKSLGIRTRFPAELRWVSNGDAATAKPGGSAAKAPKTPAKPGL